MSATRIALLSELGRALGCAPSRSPIASSDAGCLRRPTPGLPDRCYYSGDDFGVAPPPVRIRDETRIATASEREAQEMIERDRAALRRFFAGRYSRRLGRVVRPRP